jgi:flagellar basal-body rod protein FlgC
VSLLSIFDIAGSGMSAQTVRMNATASNIANAETVSSNRGETYRAKIPLFSAMISNEMNNFKGAQVRVDGVVESQAPLRAQYRPDHPMADAQGNIYLPNVNLVEEMANMISASRSYQTNIEVLNTSKQMLMRTLSLGE